MTQSNLNQAGVEAAIEACKNIGSWEMTDHIKAAISAYLECVEKERRAYNDKQALEPDLENIF